jgi:hypothetical protein
VTILDGASVALSRRDWRPWIYHVPVPEYGMEHSPEEIEILQLLKDLQEILASALNSLSGKTPPKSPEAFYMSFVAKAVNTSADGYLVLRNAYRVSASKLLIRPALEVILGGVAVEKEPGLLVRKAYSEWEERDKMFKDPVAKTLHKQYWDKFEKRVRAQDPTCPIVCKHLGVRETAKLAMMEEHYEISYRIYCKFTHGAFEAIAGQLDSATDDRDSLVMAWCVFQALGLLGRQTPATFPDMKPYFERVDRLLFQPRAGSK